MSLKSLVLQEGNRDYHSDFPLELITGTGLDPRPRMRVDPAQTSFFEGREFRAFYEMASIAAGSSVQFRFIAPLDFVLQKQAAFLRSGDFRLEIYSAVNPITGAATPITPSGTWTQLPTILGKNRMSDRPLYSGVPYVRQCNIETGGTFTGGSLVDIVLLSALPNGNQIQTVGQTDTDQRGLPATTFYGKFVSVTGAASPLTGVYYLEWEERQPASPLIVTT